jgi:coatomer subunit delta
LASLDEGTASGSLEFTISGAGDDAGVFFPVQVSFNAVGSLAGMTVTSVQEVGSGADVTFSTQSLLGVEDFVVG